MLLEVEGLQSGYGKLTVLHGVALTAEAGRITAILGSNGAGKSTIMKTIARHLPVKAGTVRFDGQDVAQMGPLEAARAGIGYVPQDGNVFAGLSVRDNLRAAALVFDGAEARVADVLRRFPILEERGNQVASSLSGGERQTLAIATALIGAPRLLLLDEPTAGLAPIFVDRILDWVRELTESGMGVVWVIEQNPEKVLAISGHTHVIEAGRTARTLPSHELLQDGRVAQVLFDEAEG
jgi:branched-chain amino acid transport system ATP-binding protein